MKKQHLLSICIAGALLTACSSGGSSGMKNNNINIAKPDNSSTIDNGTGNNGTNQNTENNELPHPRKVPQELQNAVNDAQKMKIIWSPMKGQHSETIGNKSYNKDEFIYAADFDMGYTEHPFTHSNNEYSDDTGKVKIYRMSYVTIFNFITDKNSIKNNTTTEQDISHYAPYNAGYFTDKAPSTGKATYKGIAFVGDDKGQFNLDVDFGHQSTSGKITNLSKSDIILEKGNIKLLASGSDNDGPKKMGFIGIAKLGADYNHLDVDYVISKDGKVSEDNYPYKKYKYNGHFYGPKAEEVAGMIYGVTGSNEDLDTELATFAGQRGKIKK